MGQLARFELWTRQLIVDAKANKLGWVNGDIASLEWTRDRLVGTLDPADLTRVNRTLLTVRENAVDGDLAAASTHAVSLRRIVAAL